MVSRCLSLSNFSVVSVSLSGEHGELHNENKNNNNNIGTGKNTLYTTHIKHIKYKWWNKTSH